MGSGVRGWSVPGKEVLGAPSSGDVHRQTWDGFPRGQSPSGATSASSSSSQTCVPVPPCGGGEGGGRGPQFPPPGLVLWHMCLGWGWLGLKTAALPLLTASSGPSPRSQL